MRLQLLLLIPKRGKVTFVAEDGRRREEGKRVVRLQVAEEIVIYSARVS
jgi:hypothetical protein